MSAENDLPGWAATHPGAWDGLRAAWRDRFSALPWRCAATGDPGVVDAEIWRDWDVRESTPDQLRIEHYLDRHALRGRTILHVGIGNSRLTNALIERKLGTRGTGRNWNTVLKLDILARLLGR